LEQEVGEKFIDRENTRLMSLKEKQLQEKKEILEKYLPESMLKDFIIEMNEEEHAELDAFR
jgi:hypothetical protein